MLSKQVLWVAAPCGSCHLFTKFRRIVQLSVSGLELNSLITLKMKAVGVFETSERNYPTTRRKEPEGLLCRYEKKFATNKIFQRCVISTGSSGSLYTGPLAHRPLRCSFSLACYNSDKSIAVIIVALLILNRCCREHLTLPSFCLSVCLSLSLSLSLSHTCTHSNTHTLSHKHLHTYTLTLTHTLSLTHTHTHSHTPKHTHRHTHTLKHAHIHSNTHSHTHTLKHSLARTHTHPHSLPHTHAHSCTHALSRAHSNTHTLARTHAHTRTHSRAHSHILTHIHSNTLSHTHTLTHTHTFAHHDRHAHTHTHTYIHTLTHKRTHTHTRTLHTASQSAANCCILRGPGGESSQETSSSIGTTAHCGLWPVEQCPSIFSYLPPTLSIFSLLALEDLFLLPLSIFSWVFPFFSSLQVLE